MKTSVTLKVFAAVFLMAAFSRTVPAQTYFTESFESAFTGNPAAPPGWTQTRVRLLGGVVPAANNVDGPKDWARNTWSGTAWAVAAYTPSTDPGAPPDGSAALWMEDSYFGGTGTNFGSRRVVSPNINLASSTSPYLRFRYAYGALTSTGLNFRVLVSADDGTTWQMLSAIPGPGAAGWNKINLWIPPAYRTANFRFAFEMTNTWGSSNLFVDHVRVEEFTPTTITSNATGNWNTPGTWVGGVVPDADNHVVIAAGHTVSSNGNIDRCQNLTVNGTFQYLTTTATQLIQILGNLTVNSGGTYNSHSGTTGKRTYLNGNVTVNTGGTLNFSSTGALLILFGAHPATYTNTGTLTAGHIRNTWFVNTAGVTINSALTISQTLSLVEGPVNPNGFLTVGNSTVATTQTLERAYGSFTAAPTWGSGVTRSQSYLSGGSINFIPIRINNLVPGEEVPLFSGVRTIQGTMTMNTWGNVELSYPLTVGTATSGGLTLTRGIIKTTATNLLTLSSFIAGPTGTAPSTTTFFTTHGSYVAGPLRIQFPTSGTATRNFAVGVGSDFNGVTPNANRLRTVSITTTTAWSGQDITVTLLGPPAGPVTAPLTTTMGLNVIRVQRNGASPDLPATATIQFAGNNYTPAYSASSDNMIGTQGQLAIAQATTPGGTWVQRSALSGAGLFSDNTNYSRTATGVAPLATNGEYFCLATTLPAVNDWSVVQLYTLGKTALSFGDNHVVKAYIRNLGTSPATKTVSLNVTGANTFSNTQSVTLNPGQWTVVSFAPYTNTSLGTNTVTVSVPADDVTANDTRNYTQQVTSNLMGYKEPSLPNDGGVGYTGATGDFIAKFTTATTGSIDELKVDFHSSGTPQPYRLGIWDDDGPGGTPGTLLHETSTLTSTPGSTAFVPISPAVSVSGGFFVGVRQINTTNVAFGYQTENPIRQDGFYFAPGSGSNLWSDFAMPPSPFRFSIESQFFVPTPPNCATAFNPPNLATGICSGGTLSWASGGGGPTGYRIYFGTSPTPPLVDSTSGTTWTLPTLTPATTYYWQIVPYNAYGYATGCSTLSFTSHASPSPCVCNPYCAASQTSGTCASGDEYISSVTFNTLSNTSTCAASLPAGYTNYTSGPTTTVLRGNTYTLTMINGNPFSGDQGRAFIDWNQDGDFDDAGESFTLTTSDFATFTASITIPLTSTLGTTRMRVRLYYTGTTPACGAVSFGEAEDYCITVADPVPCSGTPSPGATTASPTTACTGATVTLNLTGSLTFTGLTYNWEVSTDGGATWTSFSTSAPPVTYTYGTAPVTQFRCVVTCTFSSQSATSTPVSVTLGSACVCAPYCTPPSTDCTDDDIITNVTLGTLLSNTTTCGNPTTGFTLYTSPNPTLVLGSSYSLSVTTSASWSQGLRVWFDWNGDNDFTDAGEEVTFSSNYIGTAPATYTATVTVPLTATLGSTRMRVRCRFNAAPPTDPCLGGFLFGETEDYCITIAPPTCTWTGAVPAGPVWGIWHNAGNWDCGYVPTITTNVIIPNVAIQPAIVTANGNAYNVTIHDGTKIHIVSSGLRLNVANDWNAGTGTGTEILHGPGAVRMLASDGTGSMTGNSKFQALEIAAGTGNVTITSGSVRVRNAVRLMSGTLNTLGNLTLEGLLAPAHSAGIIDNFSTGFTGTMVGNVKAERRIPRWNPVFIGSPVNNGTVADIAADIPGGLAHNGIGGDGSNFVADPTCTYMSPSSPWARLMQYDESTVTTCAFNGWQIRLSGTTQNGRGYMLYQVTAASHPVYDFTGIANTGAITANVTRTATNTTANQGSNLLSNPYPSGIDLDAFYAANSSEIGTMAYLYNGTSFVTVNMNDGTPSRIASFQGFQVVKSVVGTSTVTFNQSMRVTGNTIAFTDAMAVPHKLEVVVTGRDAEHRDETVVYFGNELADAFDLKEDGYKFYSAEGYPTLYTVAEGTAWPVSVNGLNVQTPITEVPLGLNPGASGRFVFTVKGGDRLPAGMTCYLVDKLEQKEVKVGQETSYVFETNGMETKERFVLRFRRDVPVTVQPAPQKPQKEVKSEEIGTEADRAWTQANRVYLSLGRDVPGRLTLRLMDMSGKVVWTDAIQNAVRGVYDLGELEVSGGLYILNWSDGRSTQSARLALGLTK